MLDGSVLIDHMADPVICTTETGELVWANAAAAELLGSSLERWLGRNVIDAVHPDDVVSVINAFITVVDQSEGLPLRLRIVAEDGTIHPVETRGRPVMIDGQRRVVNVLRRIHDRFDLELGGGDPDLLRMLVHHSPAILVFLDSGARIRSASAALGRRLGLDFVKVVGTPFTDLVNPKDRPLVQSALARIEHQLRLSVLAHDTAGRPRHFDTHITDLRGDPSVGGYIVTMSDVTELKLAEVRLRELVDLDPLTGALNRRAFDRRVTELLAAAEPDLALLYCDLDRFKTVNDRFGHKAGDRVLLEFVRRIRAIVRGDDLVGRIGGDEFVIGLVGDAAQGRTAIEQRLRRVLAQPFDMDGTAITVDTSIGSAVARPGSTTDSLLHDADELMYAEKRSGTRP
jgi:diguanylate cyclase (GGDEF)-like protein/PAS domain S-box-containing protein